MTFRQSWLLFIFFAAMMLVAGVWPVSTSQSSDPSSIPTLSDRDRASLAVLQRDLATIHSIMTDLHAQELTKSKELADLIHHLDRDGYVLDLDQLKYVAKPKPQPEP